MNFTLRVFDSHKLIDRYETKSLRRFYNHARTTVWHRRYFYHLKVSYGKLRALSGRLEDFYNEGIYSTKREFWLALNAFSER